MTTDAHDAITDELASEEEPETLGEVLDRIRALPSTTDADTAIHNLLCDKLEYVAAKVKPDTRQLVAEQIGEALEEILKQ